MLDFSDPAVWWFVTRSSAIVAWVLLTLSALWGILLRTRILRGADNPDWLKTVHRYVSSLALLMVTTHLVSLYLDSFLEFTVVELLIPFSSDFEPLGTAIGVVATWLLVLVWVSSILMDRLPRSFWKVVHYSSYAILFGVAIHAGLVGSDVGTPWYTATSIGLITATILAVMVRIVISRRSSAARVDIPVLSEAPSPAFTAAEVGPDVFQVEVVTRRQLTDDVAEFTLHPVDPAREVLWSPGAHLTLHLGNGLERQYSLCGDPADTRRLVIAVLNTRGQGGGSEWMHAHLHEGMTLKVNGPIQNFPLRQHHTYLFVASGIGITPIMAMIGEIPASREWTLVYLGRSRDQMAYLDELLLAYPGKIIVWATEDRGARADLAELIDSRAQVYACGSPSVLDALTRVVPEERLHLERFSPQDRSAEHHAAAITVVWQPTGQDIAVAPNESVLDGLEKAGISLNASCRRGVCGSCELRVLGGTPAHLDSVMSDADKNEMQIFYPCVSRSATGTLTLAP